MTDSVNYPIGEWTNEGSSVFRIVETGEYRRGAPVTTNEFYFNVQPGHNVKTQQDAEGTARRIAALLREDDYLQKLIADQAYGRLWSIMHCDDSFWRCVKLNKWVNNRVFSEHYPDVLDAFNEVRRLLQNQVIGALDDIRIIPIDSSHFVDPVNKEDKEFVVLEGIELGNKFITSSKGVVNPSCISSGKLFYRVHGYFDTIGQAQIFLYGRSYEQLLWEDGKAVEVTSNYKEGAAE